MSENDLRSYLRQVMLKLGMEHRSLNIYRIYIHCDTGLTFDLFYGKGTFGLVCNKVVRIVYTTVHTVYPVTPNAGMFYQRGCKHLRRGNTQGKKTCNLRISIVPISNITFQTKRAFL